MVMNYIKNQVSVQMIHSHGKSTYLNNNYLKKKKSINKNTSIHTHRHTYTYSKLGAFIKLESTYSWALSHRYEISRQCN